MKLAFSRDGPDQSKYYVQHAIDENSMRLKILLKNNYSSFRFLLAGNSKYMPASVTKSFKGILRQIIGDDVDVDKEFERLESAKQIVFETWN